MRLGVILIAVFLLLLALVCLLGGITMLFFEEEIRPLIQSEFERISAIYGVSGNFLEEIYDTVVFSLVLVGLVYLFCSIGLLMLKNWARFLAIFLFAFQMLYSTLLFLYDPFAIIYIIIGVLAIWYLLRKDVLEAFSRKASIEERILGQKS